MVHITSKTQGKAFTVVFEYVLSVCLLIWKWLPIRTFAQICVFYLRLPFSAWCPHILAKSVASSYRFVYVCTTFYWTSGTKGLRFKHLHHLPFCHSRTFVKKRVCSIYANILCTNVDCNMTNILRVSHTFRGSHPERFCENVFSEILQSSQENTCARDLKEKIPSSKYWISRTTKSFIFIA